MEVEFLGIAFRSASHLAWFKMNLTIFVLSWAWYLASRSGRHWRFLSVFCSATTFNAIFTIAVRLFKGVALDGEVYSRDCIWFNGLMAFIYLSHWWLAKTIAAKKNFRTEAAAGR